MQGPTTVAAYRRDRRGIAGRTDHPRAAAPPVDPTTASIIHLGPESSIAPAERAVVAPAAMLVIPFAKNTGDFVLSDEQAAWCRTVHAYMRTNLHAQVLVTGHTDADGDSHMNRDLSGARARLVMEALVNAGLPAERINAEGRGSDEPIADNTTSKGKAQNRRVEVSVVPVTNAQNP